MSLCDNEANVLTVAANCRNFDFTLAFEDAILSVLPEAIFCIVFTLRLWYLFTQNPQVKFRTKDWLYYSKQIIITGIFATKLATLILRLGISDGLFAVTKASYALSFVASALLFPLVHAEHLLTPQSSTVLSSYILILTLLDAARIRTYVFTSLFHEHWFIPFLLAFALKIILLLVESINLTASLLPDKKDTSKEATTNVFARYFVLWLVPLFWRGRHSRLDLNDLQDVDPSMQTQALRARFAAVWSKEKRRSHPSLLRASWNTFPLEFLATFPPGIVWVLATFAQPYILQDLLSFIDSYQTADGQNGQPLAIGISLTCAYALVYIIISLAYTHTQIASIRLCVKFRGAIVSSIFEKSLVLHSSAAQALGASSAYNLMSVDIERFVVALVEFPETWTAIFSIGVGLWLLWRQVGVFFLVALGLLFLLFGGLPKLGDITDRSMDRFSADSDERVKMTASVINNVKSIKLSGYKNSVMRRIMSLRVIEIGSLRRYFQASSSALMIGNVLPVWLEFLVYASYGGYIALRPWLGKTLDTNSIFTTLAILQILTDPLVNAAIGFPALYGAYVSLRRIQTFFLAEELDAHSDNELDTSAEKKGDSKSVFNVHDISVHWNSSQGGDDKPLLHSLSLRIDPGTLTIVLGPVGSGKSTLLHTLLAEIRLLSGSVDDMTSNLRRAYCSQDSWIMTGTVRANICMSLPFDEVWYNKVVTACGLREDFANWDNGDLTLTGARGSALSGGQRQRLALARAVYTGADVYLLDDVFSAIDARLERSIFQALFGSEGLLVGKTVVMVGHNVNNLYAAHQIVVLEDGTTVEKGTPTELLSNPESRLARYVDQLKRTQEHVEAEDTDLEVVMGHEEDEEVDEGRDQELIGDQREKLLETYMFWAHHSGYLNTLLFVTCTIVLSGPYLLPQVILKLWGGVNDVTPNQGAGRFIGALAGITVAHSMFFAAIMWFLYQRVTPTGATNMHHAMLKGVLGTTLMFFDSTPAGRVVNRFSQDLYIITVELPKYVFLFISNSADLVVLLVYTIVASPYIAISIPPLGLIYWGVAELYTNTSKQIRRLDLSAKSPLYSHFGEAFEGLMTIRAYKMQQWFIGRNIQLMNWSQKPFYLRFIAQAWLSLYLNLIVMVIAVLLSAIAVALRHSVAVGFVGVALSNLVTLSGTLNRILYFFASVQTSIVAIERVKEFSELEPENSNTQEAPLPTLKHWPKVGSVSFENVSVRYRPELAPALRDINFSLQAGTKLGVVGRSGSGKSTLLMSLFRVIDPSQGDIRIDGVNLKDIPADVLRESISIIPQDPFLFNASIRDNLIPTFDDGLSSPVDDKHLWDILEKIKMKEFISRLEGGLDFVVSSDGDRFSRGQKQLLCFARAILQNRKVVALDEATSSIDHESDQLIQKLIREELTDRTVITIAHRLETIMDYDEIMVLSNGRIVEKGPPKRLLEDADGLFSSMVGQTHLEHSVVPT